MGTAVGGPGPGRPETPAAPQPAPSGGGQRAAEYRGTWARHMRRAERELSRALRSVDLVWEVADARCPRASRNPRLARLCGGKPRVLVLAKADLANPAATAGWLAHLSAEIPTVALDLRSRPRLEALARASREALARAGRRPPSGGFRALVAGVPNTGKSTLLNRVAGGVHAAVGARPGVTRGPQWLRLPGGGLVLDLPGILPPRLSGWEAAWRLQAAGALPGHAEDEQRAAAALAEWLLAHAGGALQRRYGLAATETAGDALLEALARRRGFMARGAVPDRARAAATLLADFRRGLLGRLTLERVPSDTQATARAPEAAGGCAETGPDVQRRGLGADRGADG